MLKLSHMSWILSFKGSRHEIIAIGVVFIKMSPGREH
jgi:hypothetical protein